MESAVRLLIYLHAALGFVALLAGGVSLVVRKGSTVHKRTGRGFYYCMLAAAQLSFVIAVWPGHESPFLFSIGLFSCYFLIGGVRSLRFKKKVETVVRDRALAYLIISVGIMMLAFPWVRFGRPNPVLVVFGILSILFGLRDVRVLKDRENLKSNWLKIHLGKMTGGYIAAVTAFFVVNKFLPGLWNWFLPTLIGTGYITYWIRKVTPAKNTLES